MRETRIKCPLFALLCAIGLMMQTQEISYAQEDKGGLSGKESVMVSPYHSSDEEIATAAVSVIGGDQIGDFPGSNRTNLLNGRVTGLLGIQSNGEFGLESNSLYVRGLRTLSGSQQTLILVDGYVRKDAEKISPSDIESITVLKDAAATALYGLRGANGVVLITTKKGKNAPLKVTLEAGVEFKSPTRMPKYLGAYEYARLYNEAMLNDNPAATPKYDQFALESYYSGDDPYGYPDVDWLGKFLNKQTIGQRYAINVSGGGNRVKYYASFSYSLNGGMFNVDKSANKYNTNSNYRDYSFRGNTQINVTKDFVVGIDISSLQSTWNAPGAWSNSTSRVLTTLATTPVNAYQIFNEDGSLGGTTQYTNNPYGLLNKSGYSIQKTRSNYAILDLSHKLDFITRGLSIFGSFSFDSYFRQEINRNVGFVVYEGNADNERGTKNPVNQVNNNSFDSQYKAMDFKLGLDYARSFNKNNVSARVFLNYNKEDGNAWIMPRIYKGLYAILHYDYDRRYVVDVTGSYQGSEQIGGNGYNLFPAVSVGWVASNEEFLKGNNSVNFLKLRASCGVSGNDGNIGYFQKSSFFKTTGQSYPYGTSWAGLGGFKEEQSGMSDIRAERSLKTNIGLDIRLFNNIWSLNIDGFYEDNNNLIISQALPDIAGFRGSLKANDGRVINYGTEISTTVQSEVNGFHYAVYGNFTFARNIIKEQHEMDAVYRFNRKTGYPINSTFGLMSDGLFYDQADIDGHAKQGYGPYQPGDIKYVDLSKDGVVNEDDRTYLGFGNIPEIVYGFGIDLSYKGFDLNVFFQGVENVQKKMSGNVYWDFRPNGNGNVMPHHLDRWAYDPANGIDTRETATYPRLSLKGNDTNNFKPNSDYWLRDASYLRLKSVELGYTFPEKWMKAIHLKELRLFVTGQNLLTFDKIKIVDPEASTSGISYPMQRSVSLGLNVSF